MPFDAHQYLAANLDLLQGGWINVSNAEWHYLNYGRNEGRVTTFDAASYLAANRDLLSGGYYTTENVIEHYITYGWRESRSTTFDAQAYRAANSDLWYYRDSASATQHYILAGWREGRSITYSYSSFDVSTYIAANSDLASWINSLSAANRYQAALDHWRNYGVFEGRVTTTTTSTSYTASTQVGSNRVSAETNGSTSGSLTYSGQRQTYSIQLNAGTQYNLSLRGYDSSEGTLRDPYLRLYNSNNVLLASDDDSGQGLNSQILFTPSTSGTYYITAGAFADSGTGSFMIGATRASAALLSQTGTISYYGERDDYTVALQTGHRYRFDLEGSATSRGTLTDPYLRVYGSGGTANTLLAYNDDSNGTLNSQITFDVTSGGNFRLQAGAYADGRTGTYTLTVTQLT
ncbi:Peptidase C-terminal archaeal/bacterial domain-containing protein [Azospirillaceae bacterium]